MQAPHAEVTRLIEARDFASARRLCEEAMGRDPDAFAPCLWSTHVALVDDRPDEARGFLAMASERGAPEAVRLRLEFGLAKRTGDAGLQVRVLERLVELEPGEPRWWRQAMALQLESGLDEAAFDSLGTLLALCPGTPLQEPLRMLAARMPEGAFLERLDALVAAMPGAWPLHAARAEALSGAGRMDAAWEDIEALVTMDPRASFPRSLFYSILRQVKTDEGQRARFEALLDAHPRSGALFWCNVLLLEQSWKPQRARELVRDNWEWARETPAPLELALWEHVDLATAPGLEDPASPGHYQALLFAGRLEEALAHAPNRTDTALLRQAIALAHPRYPPMRPARDPDEVTVAGEDRADGTVLVFTGIQDQAWVPAHVLDRFFAELGLKAIFLRDYRRLAFMCGLDRMGGSLAATLDALKALLAHDGERPVYTFGASAGGLAAVVYAEALGARASLLFSPPTTFDPGVVERMGDTRGRAWFRRLLAHIDPREFDLSRILARTPATYRVIAYAGADSPEDRAHAEGLASLPRASVRLLDGVADHNSLAHAAARYDMLDVFREAFRPPGGIHT